MHPHMTGDCWPSQCPACWAEDEQAANEQDPE